MKYLVVGLGLFSLFAVACSGSSASSGASGGQGSIAAGGAGQANGGAGNVSCSANSDCALGVCSAGACKDIACVPNTSFCADGAVNRCAADGTLQAVTQHCPTGSYCLEKAGTASCNPTSCFAGDAMCAGNLATQCEPDGSGPKPGGTDCAMSQQICYSGQCRDSLCKPGEKLCDGGTLYLCSEAGSSRSPISVCSSGEVCDAKQGACRNQICEPGKLACDSTRVVTCNDFGSGWTQSGPDCADKNRTCSSGACVPLSCQPNQSTCKNNDVYACNGAGTTQIVTQYCGTTQRCIDDAMGFAYCSQLACQPDQLGCNGDVLATCNSDGTAFLMGGTDCTLSGSVCIDGQCKATVCDAPNTMFCKDGDVQYCVDNMHYQLQQYCATGTYCLQQANAFVTCAPTPCKPDTDACVAEKLGHCAADGMSVTGATDCAAQSQVCTLAGCAASAVDAVSTGNQIGSASMTEMVGNVVTVNAARTLTLIEQDLTLPSQRSLVWAVYEQTNGDLNGEFDLRWQQAGVGSGSGFQSSGAISVPLEAGKTYLIGVAGIDGSFVYYYDVAAAPPASSFAHVTGSVDTSFYSSFDYYENQNVYFVYHQRLTTTPP